ncbi:DUF86 domain-containing protein [candidate division WOR-3 bacterium]|nr:DUF86 domain-containing protein [candidate division WOR-3 bacterium]
MASLREKVNVEMENISLVLEELKKTKDKPDKALVELAGIGTFLHNIYNGVENILKQILSSQGIPIPISDSWHQDLLIQATEKGIITETTKKQLAKYLAFRHFFIHAYGLLLDEEELRLLADNVSAVYSSFKTEIDAFIANCHCQN